MHVMSAGLGIRLGIHVHGTARRTGARAANTGRHGLQRRDHQRHSQPQCHQVFR